MELVTKFDIMVKYIGVFSKKQLMLLNYIMFNKWSMKITPNVHIH